MNSRVDEILEILEADKKETLERIKELNASIAAAEPQNEDDLSSELTEKTTSMALVKNLEAKVRRIDTAMARAKNGELGYCANCGVEIPISRLKAMPFATLCVECQEDSEK